MAYETLRYEVADRVATIALDTPDNRNALSDQLLDELIAAFAAAGADDDVGCVVLTSTHDRVFSSGANLGGFAADATVVEKHLGTERFPTLFRTIGELGKPTLCGTGSGSARCPGALDHRRVGGEATEVAERTRGRASR